MWMRDSFWQSFAITDAVEQRMITRFESKQSSNNLPYTIHSDNAAFGNHDESTLFYMIRAYYDKLVRGLTVSTTAYTNALTYITSKVTNDEYRISNVTADTWCDSFKFTIGSYSSYNQGLYCVALRCAQRLGLSVSESTITNAIAKYEALYDTTNTYIKFASDKAMVSPDALVGEALNLFLFNQPLLSNTAVNNHINYLLKNNVSPVGLKILVNDDKSYLLTTDFNPTQLQGDYQNGGSWYLYEFLAYYAGYYHGYPGSYALMQNRNNQEISFRSTSHEYLATLPSLGTFGTEDPIRHVYSWNAAYLLFKPPARQPVI